jgi:hypothetical protein
MELAVEDTPQEKPSMDVGIPESTPLIPIPLIFYNTTIYCN